MKIETNYYLLTPEQVFQKLKSNKDGLSEKVAQERLLKFGKNIFKSKKRHSAFFLFISQFANFLIVLLCLAFLFSLLAHSISHSLVILLVILFNVLMGFILEYKAERALEALKQIFTHQAVVKREGQQKRISAHELTLGDVVQLSAGDRVPADLRLFETNNLEIDQSSLTGESTASSKHINPLKGITEVADQDNMAFCGTLVTSGDGKAIVVAVGDQTYLGKIAQLVQKEREKTPLEERLNYLGKILAVISIVLVIGILTAGFFRNIDILNLFNYSIALLVSAVPEALPTIITLALAVGVIKMAKEKAIVRKLPSVETLACVNVICADKTGTLTKNEMTVKKIWLAPEPRLESFGSRASTRELSSRVKSRGCQKKVKLK